MNHRLLAALLALCPAAVEAQTVTLHSVTVDPNDDVTVVYSKNFNTCAHLRLSDPSCATLGPLVHVQNHFCASGTMVSVTVPRALLNASFDVGVSLKMVNGNNSGIQSACVTVTCDGRYGAGCAPSSGVAPTLDAVDACPPAGGSLDLQIADAAAGSLAVLGLGLSQITFPLFGCDLLIGSVQGTVVVPIDAAGDGAFSLPLPANAAGFALTSQAWVLDVAGPQGFTATNGLFAEVR